VAPGNVIGVFDRVTTRVSDREESERFYETVLGPLGIDKTHSHPDFAGWHDFSLAAAEDESAVTRRLHIGFAAPSRSHVDQFWQAGTAAGYRDDGAPGPRPQYTEDYYGSFLLDPDGNSAEAVHFGGLRTGGIVDHLWIRVRDLAASKRFYEAIAPLAGFRINRDTPERAQFLGSSGSFSLLPGEPTEHVHLAFRVTRDESVDAPHLIDPSGFNIELVNRNGVG
jgi:catechol 2,3-dioxygenase-like lactoylglutathione lyase family enzyme